MKNIPKTAQFFDKASATTFVSSGCAEHWEKKKRVKKEKKGEKGKKSCVLPVDKKVMFPTNQRLYDDILAQ